MKQASEDWFTVFYELNVEFEATLWVPMRNREVCFFCPVWLLRAAIQTFKDSGSQTFKFSKSVKICFPLFIEFDRESEIVL